MKKRFFILLMLLLPVLFLSAAVFGQQTDSLAYQLQRKKVNGLLTQRTAKFNQYFESLDAHRHFWFANEERHPPLQ